MEIISLLHVYTVPWQLVFLKNFQPLLWYFLMSWYIYHILFIISSLTVFAEPHRIALSWHCFWGTQQKIEHIFSLLSRAEKKKNRQMENYEMWLILFLNGMVLSLLTSFLCASSYCVHSVLLSSGFSHRLFLSFPVKCS